MKKKHISIAKRKEKGFVFISTKYLSKELANPWFWRTPIEKRSLGWRPSSIFMACPCPPAVWFTAANLCK